MKVRNFGRSPRGELFKVERDSRAKKSGRRGGDERKIVRFGKIRDRSRNTVRTRTEDGAFRLIDRKVLF